MEIRKEERNEPLGLEEIFGFAVLNVLSCLGYRAEIPHVVLAKGN
jgi:hypothetical protein